MLTVIRNRTYLGDVHFRGKRHKGTHAPLVDSLAKAIEVGKAQGRLTTRLRPPVDGLRAMREALERDGAGVDQPRNIK